MAKIRFDDAAILMDQNRFGGAIYIAGYAIECLLKWAVTWKRMIVYLPPDLETHTWDVLLQESGLQHDLRMDRALKALYAELADRWRPELRYQTKPIPRQEAQRLYRNLHTLYHWIIEQAL